MEMPKEYEKLLRDFDWLRPVKEGDYLSNRSHRGFCKDCERSVQMGNNINN